MSGVCKFSILFVGAFWVVCWFIEHGDLERRGLDGISESNETCLRPRYLLDAVPDHGRARVTNHYTCRVPITNSSCVIYLLAHRALLTHPTTPTLYPTSPPTLSLSRFASSCHFRSSPMRSASLTMVSPCRRRNTLIQACTSS